MPRKLPPSKPTRSRWRSAACVRGVVTATSRVEVARIRRSRDAPDRPITATPASRNRILNVPVTGRQLLRARTTASFAHRRARIGVSCSADRRSVAYRTRDRNPSPGTMPYDVTKRGLAASLGPPSPAGAYRPLEGGRQWIVPRWRSIAGAHRHQADVDAQVRALPMGDRRSGSRDQGAGCARPSGAAPAPPCSSPTSPAPPSPASTRQQRSSPSPAIGLQPPTSAKASSRTCLTPTVRRRDLVQRGARPASPAQRGRRRPRRTRRRSDGPRSGTTATPGARSWRSAARATPARRVFVPRFLSRC